METNTIATQETTMRALLRLRLTDYRRIALMGIGEMLEDAANRFLNLADQIRAQIMAEREAAQSREDRNIG